VWKISELFGISVDQICTWNKLSDDAGIRVGQMLTIYQNPPEKKAQKPKPSEGYMQYRVQPGDTPFSIARKFAMSVDELIMLNDLDSEKPVVYTDGILTVKKRADSVPQRKPVPQKPLEKSRAMKYQVSSGETLLE
jgi:LysM repeat protein